MIGTRFPTLLLVAGALAACSKPDTSSSSTTIDSTTTASSSTASSSADTSNLTPVRGTLKSISDTSLTVTTSTGDVMVSISTPLDVYSRAPATLAEVTDSSFVGVTSVAQSDGSQRATEIHIFPEPLRGTGEGSYPMQQSASSGGTPNTMTNGTVSGSQMTNGTATAPQMTNGTISGKAGKTLTVQYNGASRTIQIPANVSVTNIVPTQTKLTPGSNVVVMATKQPNGTLKAFAAMLAGAPRAR
jgi:hypothetical protein